MQTATARVWGESSSDELAIIAQRAQAFTNASGTAIALSEGSGEEIICRARAGPTAPEVGTSLRVESTFTGLCIQSGKELRCDDAETDARVDKEAIRVLGIRSMVVVPIKEEGLVVGVLAAFAPTARAFNITHVAVLKTLAGQIAAYLEHNQREEAYSPEALPAPPVKAAAVSAAPLAAPPTVEIEPAAPVSAGQLPVVPKVETVQASALTNEIDPVPQTTPVLREGMGSLDPGSFSKEQTTNSHNEEKEWITSFRASFRTLDAAAEVPEKRPLAKVLMIGAAGVLVIAAAVGLSFKLRRPAAVLPPALEATNPSGTAAVPAPAAANVQAPAKNGPAVSPAKGAPLPKREQTVVLSARPSRISVQPASSARVGGPAGARDNSIPASDAPVIFLGSVTPSGSLSMLASPASAARPPRILTQSQLEPVTVIKKVAPVYPAFAKQRRLSGSVVVQGTVDKKGRISGLQLISGPPLFRDAAFEAVKQWVFKPARLNGQVIEQSTRIRLDFGAQ